MVNENNFCVIMAGGFGTRFWPMSKDSNPKQFLDVMGSGQSMLQSTFSRFERICPRENIIIVTGEIYVDKVRAQIPGLLPYQVLSEPTRRNTAPCVAYAAAIISEINPHANIVVTPSDHAIFGEDRFVHDVEQAIAIAENNDWIVTIGVRPSSPNVKYGYIQFSDGRPLEKYWSLHKVVTFTEKPPMEMACQFIASDEFLWNSGIFIWNVDVLKCAYQEHLPIIADSFFSITSNTSSRELDKIYSVSESISIDIGIMEKVSNAYVMEAHFGWSDVETWESLYAASVKDRAGNVIVSGNVFTYDTKNTIVHVPDNLSMVIQGLDGYVVTANDNIVMICRRDQEEKVVKYASDFELYELSKNV